MIHEHDEALAVQSYAATIASLLAKCKKPKKRKAEHDTTPPEAAEKAAQEEEEEQSQRKKSKKKRLPSEEVEDEHGPVKKKRALSLSALQSSERWSHSHIKISGADEQACIEKGAF